MQTFPERLEQAVNEKRSCLVVGIDPQLERLPPSVHASLGGYHSMGSHGGVVHSARAAAALALFSTEVVQAVAPYAVAVKPNAAFFERFGAAGFDAMQEVCRVAKRAGLLVILDAKRGDIETSARGYAESLLGALEDTPGAAVDAATVNPYFGIDGIRPFLEVAREHHKGLFVLVRTSNPSAKEVQELACDGRPFFLHIAEAVARWGANDVAANGLSLLGAVVGATAPNQASEIRALLPQSPFLVPGFGAQGGTAESVRPHFIRGGRGAVVNASRAVLYAFENRSDVEWTKAVAEAAREIRDQLERVRQSID